MVLFQERREGASQRLAPAPTGGWIGRSSSLALPRSGESNSRTPLVSKSDEESGGEEKGQRSEMDTEQLPYTKWGIVGFIFTNLVLATASYFLQRATHSPHLIPLVMGASVWVLSFSASVLWRFWFVPPGSRSMARIAFASNPAYGAMAPSASMTALCYSAVGVALLTSEEGTFLVHSLSPVFFYVTSASLVCLSFTSFMFHFTSSLFEGWHRLDRAASVLFAASLASAASQVFFGGHGVQAPHGTAVGSSIFVAIVLIVAYAILELHFHFSGMQMKALDCERRKGIDWVAGIAILLCGGTAIVLFLVSSLWTPAGKDVEVACPLVLAAKWSAVFAIPIVGIFGVVFGVNVSTTLVFREEKCDHEDHLMYDVAVACMHAIVSCSVAVLIIVSQGANVPCGNRVQTPLAIACFLVCGGSILLGVTARLVGNKEERVKYLIAANALLGLATATFAWICVA